MGDPRRIRKKHSNPVHPWQKERIEEEKILLKEYGLRNKTEIWKTTTLLKNFAAQAKKLIATTGPQAGKEKIQLMQKLAKLGVIPKTAELDDVLGLSVKALLERKLQTIVFRKGLAKNIKQARQFITHGHIMVKNKKVTSPSYLIDIDEEPSIAFIATSPLSKSDHPERQLKEKPTKNERKEKTV